MLSGEKVVLRAVSRDDLPRFLVFFNDVEVELAGGGDPPAPKTMKEVEKFFGLDETDSSKTIFAIEADGKCIGFCGLFEIEETSRRCELGIFIGEKDFWGRGYGRDAVKLLLEYAFRLRNFRRVWLEVHAENERAMRSYRACGFVEEGRLREHSWLAGRYVDMVYMGILKSEV